jgi:hypothetical protein
MKISSVLPELFNVDRCSGANKCIYATFLCEHILLYSYEFLLNLSSVFGMCNNKFEDGPKDYVF